MSSKRAQEHAGLVLALKAYKRCYRANGQRARRFWSTLAGISNRARKGNEALAMNDAWIEFKGGRMKE